VRNPPTYTGRENARKARNLSYACCRPVYGPGKPISAPAKVFHVGILMPSSMQVFKAEADARQTIRA
jgi:hypothetical protein